MPGAHGDRGIDALTGELPRFVELLRMSHGPVDQGYVHCGEARVDVEELEELDEEDMFDPDKPMRAIFRCKECNRVFWGWWD